MLAWRPTFPQPPPTLTESIPMARAPATAEAVADTTDLSIPRFAPADDAVINPDRGYMYVIDTSATPMADTRVHHLRLTGGRIAAFTFKAGEPLRLPFEQAIQFLKNDGFVHVDAQGNEMPFRKAPKRPDDLQPGEVFKLDEAETVARFDELTTNALILRAAMLPESDAIVRTQDRAAIIPFIIGYYRKTREASTQSDLAEDEFIPGPDFGGGDEDFQ